MFLQEMLRLEGRGGYSGGCALCSKTGSESMFACNNCFGGEQLCRACILASHARHPLHIIKKWNGTYYESTTLKDIGLRVQLGHSPSSTCCNPERAFNDSFTIIDTTGIQAVSLDFCNCEEALSHSQQLLCVSWFPATSTRPQTAATFRVLRQFHIISLESKISAYEYYNSLARLIDNTGLVDIKNRYEAFLRMSREWRHLKMLKRAGRGHVPDGITLTSEGECAVLCPACPHPGINIPSNPNATDKRWLYALFVAINANFRLKRKKVSKDSVDPSLSQGWAYFVDETVYKRTCQSHLAVNMADTKSHQGLSATGVGTVDCARHNMKLPGGVGDLQKGEKYVNMDYLFCSAMWYNLVNDVNVSYDIACQWSKHLSERLKTRLDMLPSSLSEKKLTFFVPKFHLPAHIDKCQTTFSFNFIPGVGRTDGEAPERGWANINPVASSTKEMGPGARRDILDDHFGHSNWKKVTSLRLALLSKLKVAISKQAEFLNALEDLEEGIKSSKSEELTKWRNQVKEWENDRTKPNPYERQGNPLTMAAVQLELAREEAEDLMRNNSTALHDVCSASVLISAGLELEDQQRRLRCEKAGLGVHHTDHQESQLILQSNTLQRCIDSWVKLQHLFLPSLASQRAKSPGDDDSIIPPDAYKLMLPSEICRSIPCDERLQRVEWKLRYSQGLDALQTIRSNLRAQSCILKFKDRNLRGQGANTRARNTLKVIQARIDAAANRYDDAHKALYRLAPLLKENGVWSSVLRPLNRQDIRAMSDLLWGETEGTRKLSWIWCAGGAADGEDEAILEDMRIEWCKARARAQRWSEEVELLLEEMRRTLVFLQWDAARWEERGKSITSADKVIAAGHHAYAHRQANIRYSLAERCHLSWSPTMELAKKMDHEWRDVLMDEIKDLAGDKMQVENGLDEHVIRD
ncbi:hypothetical protein L210DRAFT_3611327 [Boletus edulis BED1]|uniref:CxC2-like cysteine cluster KDZ transposase-associated domain-containing protein n=1 Tax=Boletus edulis BED1 TaxID=1328754 RepID=A0AAD4BZC5_BOLED|nr:hypothetical protein L210DRAFT_3611327 [Boletus edulis BED1]